MKQHSKAAFIEWSHGRAQMQNLGAMLAPVDFTLRDGRVVSPLHIAPWSDEKLSPDTAPILQSLRGEWPCVPFGAADVTKLISPWQRRLVNTDNWPHGYASNTQWQIRSSGTSPLEAQIEYPANSVIRALERRVSGVPGAAKLAIELVIHPRVDTRIPVGVHPIFRLPEKPGEVQLNPGDFDEVWTYPGDTGGTSCVAPGARFADLTSIRGRAGATVDASRLPFPGNSENLLLLTGMQGRFEIRYMFHGYRVILEWNPTDFPCVLLWISNRGRLQAPWSGRHLALGVEPVCAAFDLGCEISAADNPLSLEGTKTAIPLFAGTDWRTTYTIAAELL